MRALLQPARPKLAGCLQALTDAPLSLCQEVSAFGTGPALQQIAARHFARGGVVWSGYTDPAQAWNVLAPERWILSPLRLFAHPPSMHASFVPPSLCAVLALCSDPSGIEASEELAREFLVRLEGEERVRSVVWRCTPARGLRVHFELLAPTEQRLLCEASPEELKQEAEAEARRIIEGAVRRLGAAAFDAAEITRLEIVSRPRGAKNPYAPLRTLWELGYALDEISDKRCVLIAPEA